MTDIRPIQTLTGLTTLSLAWCSSLADLSPILKLTRLQSLDLGGTNISEKQVQDIQKALPKLKIKGVADPNDPNEGGSNQSSTVELF
ncbi:MAG: hypothetical protein V1918_04120 [Planctomycetota bacterium]